MSNYYVWNKAGGAPRVAHPTLHIANAEANRLARLSRGVTFTVVKEIGSVQLSNNTFEHLKIGEKFKHGGRTLVKVEAVRRIDSMGEEREYNAVRLFPVEVAGKMSRLGGTTKVERIVR